MLHFSFKNCNKKGNNESESNCTPTTALRQMGGWKQLCTEINIAGCVMLTGRLSGRRVAYCNRITDTLGKGEALSFWISSTFRSAPCTAATAGLMYSGVKKKLKKNAFRTKCTHLQGDAHLQGTPTSHLRIRKIADHLLLTASIQKSRHQEVTSPGCYQQPSRLNSGFCLSSSRCQQLPRCFLSKRENVGVSVNKSSWMDKKENVFLKFSHEKKSKSHSWLVFIKFSLRCLVALFAWLPHWEP